MFNNSLGFRFFILLIYNCNYLYSSKARYGNSTNPFNLVRLFRLHERNEDSDDRKH
jgi:hypothetical protein